MPGLFALRPLATGPRAERMKTGSAPLKQDKGLAEKPSARLSSMGAKVMPLPFPEFQELPVKMSTSPFTSQTRAKQVSDPLGESVKARICDSRPLGGLQRFSSTASSSSGSEHEPTSVCLAEMVNDFMEDDAELMRCGRARCNCENGTCHGYGCHGSDDDDDGCSVGELSQILQGLTQCTSNSERKLLADVTLVVKTVKEDANICNAEFGNCAGSCLRRAVMTVLRGMGYNAAICKSRWDHSRGFPGGDYEYIDVVTDSLSGNRFLVDVDFRGQFQIARPTHQYCTALAAIPTIFVGRVDRLQQLVDIMTDATKRSLKRRAMHLPPWRKPEYMRAKWLAPYKRTTNEVPLTGPAIGCRAHVNSQAAAGTMAGLKAGVVDHREHQLNSKHAEQKQPSPTLLEMELGGNVDAVIYMGKVFPVGDKVERRRGAVLGEALGTRSMAGALAENSGAEVGKVQYQAGMQVGRQVLRDARVSNSDWQPPSVKPRLQRSGQSNAGLAAMLKEAGLSSQSKEQVDKRNKVMMAAGS